MKKCLLPALCRCGNRLCFADFCPTRKHTRSKTTREDCRAPWKITEAWNNNDAAALAALYTKDAVFCGGEGSGPHYGREAIEKHFAEGFKLFHFSNHVVTPDQYSPHVIGTAGNEAWVLGEWSMTITSRSASELHKTAAQLSASDSGPTPRRAKSKFLSVRRRVGRI